MRPRSRFGACIAVVSVHVCAWVSCEDVSACVRDFLRVQALSRGDNVLVHCLAGAHRAGTTGCACLMHFGGLDVQQAISVAKKLRPIIDPIGTLPALLHNLHKVFQCCHSGFMAAVG